jgi:DNA-binding IclR family transcriptional regulator
MARPKHRSISHISLPPPPLPKGVVKSAGRTMQVLEFFDDVQRPATIAEVSERLGYPQSSTSGLLHTLVAMGYLHVEEPGHHFAPTRRLALLGSWVHSDTVVLGRLIRMVEEIAKRTGDSVMLARRQDLNARYIYVLQPPGRRILHITLGTLLPLADSGTGLALLSAYPDDEIRRIVNRANAGRGDSPPYSVAGVLKSVGEARRDGYVYKEGLVFHRGAVVSKLLPVMDGGTPLALSVGSTIRSLRPRREAVVEVMEAEMARHGTGF